MSLCAEFDSLHPAAHLDRRDFMLTAAAAGFALAVQPVCAQTVVTTSAEGLTTGMLKLPVQGGTLPVYQARPAKGEALPTVLVVQEIWGVHEYIRDVCRRLAKLGYLALAPELYFRQGDPTQAPSTAAILEQIVAKVPDAQVLADLDVCAAWAAAHGGDPARLAVTGFCWGGRIVWLYAAHRPGLKAGVAWYGRLRDTPSALTPQHPLDLVTRLRAPVLGLYGGKDQGIPVADVAAMQHALEKARQPSRLVVYPESGHAFHADYRPTYNATDAAAGWQRLTEWFGKYV